MDPRPRVEVERARRGQARERKLRLIQVAAKSRTPRGRPVGWAKRFEQQPRAADAEPRSYASSADAARRSADG